MTEKPSSLRLAKASGREASHQDSSASWKSDDVLQQHVLTTFLPHWIEGICARQHLACYFGGPTWRRITSAAACGAYVSTQELRWKPRLNADSKIHICRWPCSFDGEPHQEQSCLQRRSSRPQGRRHALDWEAWNSSARPPPFGYPRRTPGG